MGTGQTLLTIGAIMLLGSIILTTNRSLQSNSEILLRTNFGLEEVSLATSIMEAASGTSFDENTRDNPVSSRAELTPAASLGQETGSDDVDDFDDYNGPVGGFGRLDTFDLSTGVYIARTRVCYVDRSNLDASSSTPTWSKRLDVSVWNKDAPGDTLRMSTIFSYWYF